MVRNVRSGKLGNGYKFGRSVTQLTFHSHSTHIPLSMAKRIRKRDLIIEFFQLIRGIGQKKGKKAAPRFEGSVKV